MVEYKRRANDQVLTDIETAITNYLQTFDLKVNQKTDFKVTENKNDKVLMRSRITLSTRDPTLYVLSLKHNLQFNREIQRLMKNKDIVVFNYASEQNLYLPGHHDALSGYVLNKGHNCRNCEDRDFLVTDIQHPSQVIPLGEPKLLYYEYIHVEQESSPVQMALDKNSKNDLDPVDEKDCMQVDTTVTNETGFGGNQSYEAIVDCGNDRVELNGENDQI